MHTDVFGVVEGSSVHAYVVAHDDIVVDIGKGVGDVQDVYTPMCSPLRM